MGDKQQKLNIGTVIPRKYTQMISIGLLVYFGISMVGESLRRIAYDENEDDLGEQQQEAEDQLKGLFGGDEEEEDDSRAGEEEDEEGEVAGNEAEAAVIKLPYGLSVNLQPVAKFGRESTRELRKSLNSAKATVNQYVNVVLDMLDTDDVALLWQIFTMVALAEVKCL